MIQLGLEDFALTKQRAFVIDQGQLWVPKCVEKGHCPVPGGHSSDCIAVASYMCLVVRPISSAHNTGNLSFSSCDWLGGDEIIVQGLIQTYQCLLRVVLAPWSLFALDELSDRVGL